MGKMKEVYISSLPEAVLDDIKKYIEASVEIYGIIPVEKLAEIINSQNDYKVSDKNIRYVYRQTKEHPSAVMHERHLVHEAVLMYDDADYLTLLSLQRGKPYKVHEKFDFLKRGERDYMNVPEIYRKLRKYLVAEVEIYRKTAEAICGDLYIGMNFDYERKYIIEEFTRRSIFPTEKQVETILAVTDECRGLTPLWENRGYSYEELRLMGINADEKQT